MKKIIALALALLMCFACISGCASKETTYTPVVNMAKALLEVKSGTATAAVVDSVMAEAMVGAGTDYSDLMIVKDIALAEEEYGIGFRNNSTAVPIVNETLQALIDDGTVAAIAEKYDLTESLVNKIVASVEGSSPDSSEDDWAYIQQKGKMVIGITEYAPMNYYDTNNELVGFDTELAEALCAKLGIEAEFVVIEWETKEIELAAKNLDCIWNGLTVDPDRFENMDYSGSYMHNKQIIVIKASNKDKYTSVGSLKGASIVAEAGSVGEKAIQTLIEKGTW